MNRREFLGGLAGLAVQVPSLRRIDVQAGGEENFRTRLARMELMRGLHRLGFAVEGPGAIQVSVALRVEPERYPDSESFSIISSSANSLVLSGASEQALLHAVFWFLERQGAFFGLDGESYPMEPSRELRMPDVNQPWNGRPRFAVRGLLPGPGLLNSVAAYNEEDFRAYLESMLRMRLNLLALHVCSGESGRVEPFLSFEYGGAGHAAFLDTTATGRWGYLPQRTGGLGMGAADFFAGEVFGSDGARLARDPWEAAERAQRLLKEAFAYAARLGIRTGIGFSPYQVPDEILRALPPEARAAKDSQLDVESRAARDLLEARLGRLLETYPDVDYVWLWKDTPAPAAGAGGHEAPSLTPIRQAYDFLRRHAQSKRLVLAGWGAADHFESFHKLLPGDVVFSCLSDRRGWEPVSEVFDKLEDRERWPVLWLEDEAAMWLPQLHVYRCERDINRAERFRSRGILGIHWRQRIADPNAGFLARFAWEESLTPGEFYLSYARTQASGSRASRLARVLNDADRDHKLPSSFSGEFEGGRAVLCPLADDRAEGFTFWESCEPEAAAAGSHQEVAEALRALAAEASSAFPESERLEYLAGYTAFMAEYMECRKTAGRLQQALQAAADLKKEGRAEEAREKVRAEALPAWMLLAPAVRRAVLAFQGIAAGRSDLGTLASIHNKFVRLALVRLRLSIKEYLGELPAEAEKLYAQVMLPEAKARPRLFLLAHPTVLAPGARVRLSIVSTGSGAVTLNTRRQGSAAWVRTPAKSIGRKSYEAVLGPFPPGSPLVEYYISAGERRTPSYFVTLV